MRFGQAESPKQKEEHKMETLVNGHSNKCNCNCGSYTINKGAKFLPGHDQRLVSIYGRELAEFAVANNQESFNKLSDKIDDHWPNLWDKTITRCENLRYKWEAKPRKESAEEGSDFNFVVKIGRWEYPAKMNQAGLVYRNSKRDGSGEWIRHNENGDVLATA